MVAPVVLHHVGLFGFDEGGDEEEGGVDDAHDVVVEALVFGLGHPPFEGQDEAEDLDEVEGWEERLLAWRAL